MLNLDVIQKLIELNDAQPLRVNPRLCLNAKHKGRACAKCLDCPTDAITIAGNTRVELDVARCVECGLCASVCPTHAFMLDRVSDQAILDAVAPHAHTESAFGIEFACKRASDTRAPSVERVMPVPCLARLSSDLLTALGAEHATVWLNDSPCHACPIGARTHPQIIALADAAERLLAAWNRGDTIRRYTNAESQLTESRQLKILMPNNPELSRRELLSFFRGNLGRAAGMVVAASLGNAPQPARAGLDEKPLERALTKLGKPQRDFIASQRFATIQVAPLCTACRVCAIMCPTRAIEYRETGGYFVLAFHPRACLGVECGLCQIACQPNALKLMPGATSDALGAREEQVLRAGALTICNECKALFATEPGEIHCPICRAAQAKHAELMKEFAQRN